MSSDEQKIYATRLKDRLGNVEKKYDDIFSAVFKKTSTTECLALIPSYPGSRHLPVQHFFDAKRIRLNSDCDSLGTSDSSRDTDSSSGSVSPQPEQIESTEEESFSRYKCDCGRFFDKHPQLHQHILLDHAFHRLFRCSSCNITVKGIRNNYTCRICKQFIATNMEDHLRNHYQDRDANNAFMECRCCYRTFKTIEEVRNHERRVHYTQRVKQIQQWPCEYCEKKFSTRHNRDAHLVGHVSASVGGIWEKIAQMQELLTDQTLVNQCPICDSVMGSRKSFRLHIIHKHLLRDTNHFITSMGLPTMSEILKALRENSNMKEQKREIKEEIEESEVKVEPI